MAAMEVCTSCKRQFTTEEDFLQGTSQWRLCEAGHLWFNCSCATTLTIKKGKFDWFSPEKVMNAKTASLFNRLSKKTQMPYIPTSVMQLQLLLTNENTSGEQLASAAKKDPLLATDIIAHANNMKLSSREKVTSLVHAISYIGRPVLAELAVLAAIKSFKFKTKRMSSDAFWNQAKLTGLIAEELTLAYAKSDLEPDKAYLAGALCNIGKVVEAICIPDTIERVFAASADDKIPFVKAEEKYKAPSHCVLGELGCTLWGLPPYITEAAAQHHNAKFTKRSYGEVAALANQMSHILQDQEYLIEDAILEACLQTMKIDDAGMATFLNKIKSQIPYLA